MTQLAALNVKITGDSSDLQSDLTKAEAGVKKVGAAATVAQTKTTGFTGGLSKLGNVSGSTRAKIQNTSFQLQDIAVQLQGGTKASTALAQQLPQLLGGFGALGAVLGVVAGVGIPAAAFALSAMGDEAFDLDEALKDLKDTVSDMQAPMSILKMSAIEISEKYGLAAERVLNFAKAQAEIAAEQASRRMSDQITIMDDLITRYARATKGGHDQRNALRDIEKQFGLTGSKAVEFADRMSDIGAAETFEDQQAALQAVLDLLEQNNISLADIPESLQTAISEMITFSNETDRARQIMAQLRDMANQVGVSPLDPFGGAGPYVAPKGFEKDKKGGRGNTDTTKSDLEKLQESLMTEEELQIASLDRQQETLRAAMEKKLLTRQEFNELMQDAEAQHAERMAGIAVYKYGDTLAKTGQFMGDMASAMQSGNDKMLQIARIFGAAEALINSYRAYNQVIADPSLPWYAKIPAAVSVLGAGLGMVNAIRGVSSGGAPAASGGAPAASGAVSSAASGAAAPQTSNNVAISLTGGDMFSRGQVIELINSINDAVDDGARIRLV